MRAVYHIAAQRKALESIADHVVDGVQVGIGGFEGRGRPESGIYQVSAQVSGVGPLRQVTDSDVAERVVIELVAERFTRSAGCDINILLLSIGNLAPVVEMVAVFERDLAPGVRLRQFKFQPPVQGCAHVNQPDIVGQRCDSCRGDLLPDAVRLAHLGGDAEIVLHGGLRDVPPRFPVERFTFHRQQGLARIHPLTPKTVGKPGSDAGIFTLAAKPGIIGRQQCPAPVLTGPVQARFHERAVANMSPEQAFTVPPLTQPEDEFVLPVS